MKSHEEVTKLMGTTVSGLLLAQFGKESTERLKYVAHSTPQSGMFYAAERGLTRGPKDSTATVTVRDLHDQLREVKVDRKVEYLPKTQGDRSLTRLPLQRRQQSSR